MALNPAQAECRRLAQVPSRYISDCHDPFVAQLYANSSSVNRCLNQLGRLAASRRPSALRAGVSFRAAWAEAQHGNLAVVGGSVCGDSVG